MRLLLASVLQCLVLSSVLWKIDGDVLQGGWGKNDALSRRIYKAGELFQRRIDCGAAETLTVIDKLTGKQVEWISSQRNGTMIYGLVPGGNRRAYSACVKSGGKLCECFEIVVERSVKIRRRRSITDFYAAFGCGASTRITKGEFAIEVTFSSLSTTQLNQMKNKVATFFGVTESQVFMRARERNIYLSRLEGFKYVASWRTTSTVTLSEVTSIEYLIACTDISASDSRVSKQRNAAADSSLEQLVGYPVISWIVVSGTVILPTTQSPSTTSPALAPKVLVQPSLVLTNTTFRLEYQIPANTFQDSQGRNTRSLTLYLYESSGQELSKNSWINLNQPQQIIKLYTSKAIYDQQPSGGYKFILNAMDSEGRTSSTELKITLNGPITPPNYLRSLVLSSTTSVIVTSYKDVDVLFLLQSKMASYLNVTAESMVNNVFKLTRNGNTALSIQYTFSTRSLVGSTCNLASIINLRSKLVGSTAQENFKKILAPQFTVNSMSGESYTEACSYLSSSAATVSVSSQSYSIQIGQYFSFSISQSLFQKPAGSNMRLRLELRSQDNIRFSNNYWVGLSAEYLDQNVNIQGLASLNVAKQQTLYSLRLVALTPILVESYQTIQFNLPAQQVITKVLFSVIMTQNSIVSTTYITFSRAFVSYMSTYLSISQSSIIIMDYKTTTTLTTVIWTISSLSQTPCNTAKINEMKQRLVKSDGQPNDALRSGLSSNVNFSPASVTIKLSGVCDSPTINYKIPMLYIPQYGSLEYQVPSNAFKDGSDGYNLTLSLLQQNGHALSSTSWIWLNSSSRLISGFPFSDTTTMQTFNYILRAVDSDAISVDQNISISLNWVAPQRYLAFLMHFSYNPSLLPVPNVITAFIKILKIYFGQPSANNIIVSQTIFLSNNKIRLYYQNTSLRTDTCDVRGYYAVMDKIRKTSSQTIPSANFLASMQPLFGMEEVGVKFYGKCIVANRNGPVFNIGDAEARSFFLTMKYVPYCGVKSYLVPEKQFNDEEEGFTRSLTLSFLDRDSNPLSSNSWVNINTTSQTIYAVADDAAYKQDSTYDTFQLRATDSDNKYDSINLKFATVGVPPVGYFNITMRLNVRGIGNQPNVLQIAPLLNSLQNMFPNGPSIHVRSYTASTSNMAATTAMFVWSPCNMTKNSCNSTAIKVIRDVIFNAGTKTMSSNLNSVIDNRFTVTSVTESLSGPCYEEGPVVNVPIPTRNIGFCGPFSYKIPAYTFTDKQDGNTERLALTLVKSNGDSLQSNYWLQFDSSKQLITAVLTQEQSTQSFPKQHAFILTATDSTKLSTNLTITVMINGAMTQYSHTFTIQTQVTLPSNSHVLYSFATKLRAYFGDNKKSFQAISQNAAANNKWIITWSNCSLRHDPCDVLGLKQIKEKMQNSFGTLETSFQQSLAPEFTNLFLSETNLGPCQTNRPPTVVVPFGPISVTTCQTYKSQIPEGTFNDHEQGNSRHLDLTLKNNQNNWISFDSTKQELTVLATNQIAASLTSNSVTVVLAASDVSKQEARQDLVIKIVQESKTATQKVNMQYRINSLPPASSFISKYQEVRNKIVQYFSSTSVLSTVEYETLPTNVQAGITLNAEWSSCSLPRDSCDSDSLKKMAEMVVTGNSVNQAFKTAMQENIDIINATFERNGLCKDHVTPPVIQNPLPTLSISYCGYLAYQIPENTFYDNIDGNTRKLTLSLLSSSNNPVTTNWLQFNTQSQTLYVILADDSLPGVTTPTTLNYKIKATAKRGISISTDLRLQLNRKSPNESINVKLNFVYTAANPPSRNVILSNVLDRYAAYFNGEAKDFRYASIKQESNSQPYFIVQISNCSLPSDMCDEQNFHTAMRKINTKHGTQPAFTTAMGSDLLIQYAQVIRLGPCDKKNVPPKLINPLGPIQVYACSDFTYAISTRTFYDEEDTTLSLSVTRINGLPVSGNYRWVRFISSGYTLYGVVTDVVLQNQPTRGYNLTIRATDSHGAYAETSLLIKVVGEIPQTYYQFSLQLTSHTPREQFLEERDIIMILNTYFQSNFTNIITYTKTSSAISVKSSICTLPNKCDESAASNVFRRIVTSQNTVPTELASQFASKFTLTSTAVYRDQRCQGPLNPPVPTMQTWTITGSYCGGFNQLVPADLFNDPEDGNTRKLTLNMYLNSRTAVPLSYWVQINKTAQVIYGWPSRATTTAYTTSSVITLVAVDRTGQEGSVKIEFSFTQHQEPKYIYRTVFLPIKTFSSTLEEAMYFAKSLRSYLRDSSSTSVGLIGHTQTMDGMHFFNYANCSVSYDPCDIVALNSVKNMLYTTTNLATQSFKDAMKPGISVNYGRTQILSPCSGTTNHPPQVKTRITTIYISVCGMYSFRIPANTFYDTEEGNTRKLTLGVVDDNNRALSSSSWLQFDVSSQTITAFATATSSASQPENGYSFIVTATDSSKLSASNAFRAKIFGPLQPLRDCKIEIVFNADQSLSSSSNNALSQIALNGLSSYFKLGSSEIGLVNFIRQSNTMFNFAWSYCSPSYTTYISTTSSSQSIPIDYKGLVTKILMRLFKADRKTVQTAFYSAFSQLTVQSVKTVFTGSCSNIPPVITQNITQLSLTVANCGYRKEPVQNDLFYDYEDGYTFDMKLNLLTNEFKGVAIDSWVNIDTVSRSLLMSLRDMQRINSQTDFMFYLQAIDSKGANTTLPIKIMRLPSTTAISPFNITFEFTLASQSTTNPYVNESIILSDVTSRLYALNGGQNIITREYIGQAGLVDSRRFTWITCSHQLCSTSAVLQRTKQLFQANLNVFTSFKQSFQSQLFTLQRAYYISSCNTPVYPPIPSNPTTIEFNITMCSSFTYQIPFSTFYDNVDGEMNNMRVRLLDNDKKPLASSSWIQLNTATLRLYAIYQSSMLGTSSKSSETSSVTSSSVTSSSVMSSSSEPRSKTTYFQLEATNSHGLTAYKKLKMNIIDYPYTSDCFVTLEIKRHFGPSSLADLDVLYKLVNVISSYYSDRMIKVSKFNKISTFKYSLTFSNCSFVFATMKAAKWGLSESHRSAITAIFSRMINSDGTAKESFSTILRSNGFTLTSVKPSYSCIDEPPYATVESKRAYAFLCQEFKDYLSYDTFRDARDGTNLRLSLCYTNGKKVSPNEWVQLDQQTRSVYGSVTRYVKENIPSFRGYSYLLVATDSSGRSANMSYVIKIANAAPVADAKFILGFTSTFTEYTKTVDILAKMTTKLGLHIDGVAQVNNIAIYAYNAMYLLTWENCTLQCDHTSITNIMLKLQKDLHKPQPSAEFIAAMGPEITPTYIYVNAPKCLPTKNETIIVTYRIIIRKPMCGFFSYEIPSNAFRSSSGQTTRDLYLTMKTSMGEELFSNSIINFNIASQNIEGVPVFTRLSSSMTYRLTATSSRSTYAGATTTVRVDYPDYNTYARVQSNLCSMKTTVTTTYNPDFSDVYILKKFIQKIANYFDSDTQKVQITSYTRTNDFPIKFTISFSNCTWLSLLQTQTSIGLYYQRISTVLRKIFSYSGTSITGFKQTFANSLKPDFNLISITANTTTCTQPPDKPPKPKNPLTIVTAASCGEFNYQIPVDFFSDEDGGTRTLNVEFLSSDNSAITANSWLVYDNKTQTISGLPLNETLINQPLDGYKYVIKATDSNGKSGYANLTIKIDGKPYAVYSDKQLTLYYETTIETSYQMSKILAITRKVSSFKLINDPMNRFRVISVKFILSRILIKLMNCSECNPISLLKYSELVQKQSIQFNEHMKPEFPTAFVLTATGVCKPGTEGIRNKTEGFVHNVTFCSITRIDFLKTLSLSQLDPGTKLSITGADLQPLPVDSWFWLNETSNVLEAFANEAAWSRQPANGTAFTWTIIDVTSGQRVSSFMEDRLRIIGSPSSSDLMYNMTIDTLISPSNTDAYFISIAFNAMTSYLNRNDLQFVSLTRIQGSILRLSLMFRICGLPSDCTTTGVKELDNKIFESPGKLRSQFKAIFPNAYDVISVTDNCKNQPPIIPKGLNITIPICGLYRYKIPVDFASDSEDGNAENLLISLRTAENLPLPRDSWIRFGENSRVIYALPTESVVRTPKKSGWNFVIVVKDKGGKEAQTGLTVFISNDIESYYTLSISFETVNIAISSQFLDIQIRFLTMMSTYFSDKISRYRVLTFANSGTNGPKSESFFIRIGNCSVTKHMCLSNKATLTTTQQTIASAATNPSSQFARYISQYFKIVSAKGDSLFTIDKPPNVLNSISVIRLGLCDMLIMDIPAATFYDEEQGISEKLVTRLIFLNNTTPKSSYWIQLINNKIYIVPYGDTKPGTYYMKLSAIDHCGQQASTTVTIILNGGKTQNVYSLNMAAKTTTTSSPVYYIAQLKLALKNLLGDSTYHTRMTMYSRDRNSMRIKWANCTVPCDKQQIGKIKNKVFLAYDVVNPALSITLRPYYNVTSITEERSKNCTIPPTLPPVANRSLIIQVPLCRKMKFSVPVDTFYDPEDGNTRSLSLSLLTESKQAISIENWVQFDSTKQILYGYPRTGNTVQFKRIYNYLLVATDKEGNSASTSVTITIVGDLPQVLYQLSVSGQTNLDKSLPNVAQEIVLINKIGEFFKDYSINDISYYRNGNSIRFSWSFCSMRTDKCDCYKIQEIRRKFTPITIFQQYLNPQFTVASSVTEQFHGVCADTRNPELRFDRNELLVPPGQTFRYDIRYDKFYDYEDGFTRNLTIYATDFNNNVLDDSAWLKIQNYKICGILTLYRSEQMNWLMTTTTTRREYQVVARDRCGKETKDSFIVRLTTSVPKLGYKIVVYLGNSFGKNCTKMEAFVMKISKYIKTKESSILVYNYTKYNTTNNSTVITWGLRNLTELNCRNDTVKIIREKFILEDDRVDPKFVDYMKPDYEVVDVKDERSEGCINATIIIPPPIPPGGFPWWILILLLIIALLILLCCLCWICIPRCCPGCCGKFCGCCAKCCQPGGKYASLDEEDGVAGTPNKDDNKDDKANLGSPNDYNDWDYNAEEDMLKQDIYSDGVGDDYGEEGIGDDGIGDDGIGDDGIGDEGIGDNPIDDDTAGDGASFTRDQNGTFGQDDTFSQYSGISEVEMNTGTVPMVETAPITFDDSPPPNMYPPLYSSVMNERRRSRYDETDESMSEKYEDDRFADVLSKPLTVPDDRSMTMAAGAMENEAEEDVEEDTQTIDQYDRRSDFMLQPQRGSDVTMAETIDNSDMFSRYQENNTENEAVRLAKENFEEDTQTIDQNDQRSDFRVQPQRGSDVTMAETVDSSDMFSQYQESKMENELSFESTEFQESSPYPQLPVDDLMQQRRLPRPSIDYVDTMPVLNTTDFNATTYDKSTSASANRQISESRRSSESYSNQLPVPGSAMRAPGPAIPMTRPDVPMSGPISPSGPATVNSNIRRSSQTFTEESSESFQQSRPLLLPGMQQPRRRSITRPVEIQIPRSAFNALQGENFYDDSRANDNTSYSVERGRSATSEFSSFDDFLNRRANISMDDTENRRRSLTNQNFDDASFVASPKLTIRRRSAPLLDDDFTTDRQLRRSSSEVNFSNGRYLEMPLSDVGSRQGFGNSLGQRPGYSTTERRSSRQLVSEEFQDGDGRRVSVVETFRDSPFVATRRRSTSQKLLTDAALSRDNITSGQQPMKMKLGNDDAYRLLKRGSIQFGDGELRSDGRRLSQASFSEGYFGDSETASFRPIVTSESFVQDRSSRITQNNRPSKAGRKRRASRVREVNTKSYQYEMGPRGSQASYVNDAYDSDSFV